MSAIAFLLLCFCTTVVSGDEFPESDSVVKAAPGDLALLPCYSAGNVMPSVTSWKKNGVEIITGGVSSPLNTSASTSSSNESRLALLPDGSLSIGAVERADDGVYLCASTLPSNTFHARVQLQVANGPDNVSIVIDPVVVLPNGTFTTVRGSSVYFNCAGISYPSQELTFSFTGLTNVSESLVNNTGKSLLEYRIDDIQPSAQGTYSCIALNQVSQLSVSKSADVLVYYASDRHPECMWTLDSTYVFFHCSWLDVYPAPMLNWTDVSSGRVLASDVTDSLVLKMNSSLLLEGQTLRCTSQHKALRKGADRSCTFTLKTPYPTGEPLATALEGTSVTLDCSETTSTPPAVTTWRRGLKQELIMNDSKYIVTAEGPRFTLTIVNITKEDEGVYFCRSENPLGARELEVYLTVKLSSAYPGAMIGLFIAVLIVGSAIIIAKTVYSSRHKICLGGFGRMDEDRGDVLSLVESDDDEIFQTTVPRLPPVSNGCQTTLVEIHRIPSTDHEEAETVDDTIQQQDNTEKTEEPEDLVTF